MTSRSFKFVHWNILKLPKYKNNNFEHDDNISKILNKLKPSIVSLCEVTNYDQLYNISKGMHNMIPYFVKSLDTHTEQNCGILSKFIPFHFPSKFTKRVSKHCITKYIFGNMKIAIISCHLLANPHSEFILQQRQLQAIELKSKINSLIYDGHEVILAGDLNDFDNNIRDANNSKSITKVLEILKEKNMINTDFLIDKQNRHTFTFNNKNVMLDHILVTPALLKSITNINIERVRNRSIDDSDHDPIIIEFDLSKSQ